MKKLKLFSILCIVCLVFSVVYPSMMGIVYATNSTIVLDFGDESTITDGKAYYGEAYIELCYDDNGGYTTVSIADKRNTPIDLSQHYRLHVVGDNVDLEIDGTKKMLPGDRYYGLHDNEFNGNEQVVCVSLKAGSNAPQPPQAQEGKVILDTTEIIDIEDSNKLEYTETGAKFTYDEHERKVIAEIEDNKILDSIEVTGDIELKIVFKGANSKILSKDDYSIKMGDSTKRVEIVPASTASGEVKLTLDGGVLGSLDMMEAVLANSQIVSCDVVILDGGVEGRLGLRESNLTIGQPDAYSSKGFVSVPEYNSQHYPDDFVLPMEIEVTNAVLKIYSDTSIISANPNEECEVVATSGGKIIGECLGTAFENVSVVGVATSAEIDVESNSQIGTFTPMAQYYKWQENIASKTDPSEIEENVVCTEGEHPNEKYTMTKTNTKLYLKSISGNMFPLSASTNPDNFGQDAIVENGTFEVISGNGFDRSFGDITEVMLEAGTEVTVRLLPDYGYQFREGGINGFPIVPEEGSATYSFIMPDNPLHISAIFEEAEDSILLDENTGVKGASISGLEGQISGTAQFTVEAEDDLSAFEDYINDGSKIVSGLDLRVEQMILKAGTNEYWEEIITDLEEEMDITLELDPELVGENTELYVLREHNGEKTKIPATLDKLTNKLSFKTGEFSTYAIAFDEKVNSSDTDENKGLNGNTSEENKKDNKTPKTGDNVIIYAVVFAVALTGIVGFSIINKRKKKC